MKKRCSIRRYKDKRLPQEIVRTLVENAMTAPSPSNSQPVRYYHLISSRVRDGLRRDMEAGYQRLRKLAESADRPKRAGTIVRYYWRFSQFMLDVPDLFCVCRVQESGFYGKLIQAGVDFQQLSVLAAAGTDTSNNSRHSSNNNNLVAAGDVHGMPAGFSPHGSGTDLDMATGMSVMAFILKAQSLGLGTCVLTAPFLFMGKALELPEPDGMVLQCFLTCGFPDEDPEKTPRKPFETIYRTI